MPNGNKDIPLEERAKLFLQKQETQIQKQLKFLGFGDVAEMQEATSFNNMLQQQLGATREQFAPPEALLTIPEITPEQIAEGEAILTQQEAIKDAEKINFFDIYQNKKIENIKTEAVVNPPFVANKEIEKSLEGVEFKNDIEDHRKFALEHLRDNNPDEFQKVLLKNEQGLSNADDEISLINTGIRLKFEALGLKAKEQSERAREGALQIIGSEEFDILAEQQGVEPGTLEQQLRAGEETADFLLSASPEFANTVRQLEDLQIQGETYIEKLYQG